MVKYYDDPGVVRVTDNIKTYNSSMWDFEELYNYFEDSNDITKSSYIKYNLHNFGELHKILYVINLHFISLYKEFEEKHNSKIKAFIR